MFQPFGKGRETLLPNGYDSMIAVVLKVSRQYFSTIGQRIVRGRDFNQGDSSGSPPVAIVNQAFVKRFFPGEDPLGKHFGMDTAQYAGTYEIVGVARDAKYNDPEVPARPMFFVPLVADQCRS